MFQFDIRCFLLPGNVVESKRNPLIFRFLLLVTSTPDPESYEIGENDDATSDFDDDDSDDDDDDDARTRIIRG